MFRYIHLFWEWLKKDDWEDDEFWDWITCMLCIAGILWIVSDSMKVITY